MSGFSCHDNCNCSCYILYQCEGCKTQWHKESQFLFCTLCRTCITKESEATEQVIKLLITTGHEHPRSQRIRTLVWQVSAGRLAKDAVPLIKKCGKYVQIPIHYQVKSTSWKDVVNQWETKYALDWAMGNSN